MKGFSVNLKVLQAAEKVWEEQADNLQAARKRLAAAGSQSESLGDRVGPIAMTYFETWRAEAGSQARAAQGHANALSMVTSSYALLDEQAVNRLKDALPWGQASAIQPALINPTGLTGPASFTGIPDLGPTEPPRTGPQP